MRIFPFLFWIWILVIVVLMVKPMDGVSRFNFPGVDKLVHFILFFILGFLYVFYLAKPRLTLQLLAQTKTFYFLLCFTLLIEFTQLFLSYRSFEILDIGMNFLGLFSGLSFGRFFLNNTVIE